MIPGCDLVYSFNTHTILHDSDISIITKSLSIQDINHNNNYSSRGTKVLASKITKASKPSKPRAPTTNKHIKSRHKLQ